MTRAADQLRRESGSAMVEAAIIFPILMLLVWWSAAMTDVLILKLKAAEAARFALFETTVFSSGPQIDAEVQRRFVDLRSPASIEVADTGLLMYPLAVDLAWSANVNTSFKQVALGGTAPTINGLPGIVGGFVNLVLGWITKSVDGAMKREKFNTRGSAGVRITLVHARHDENASIILKGGDLLGNAGGNDLDHPASMTDFTFQAPLPSERPLQIVFDTWKAWPKPPALTLDGAPTNIAVSPYQTYPTVEQQTARQVEKIAFFGLTSQPWVTTLRNIVTKITGSGISQAILGGRLPDVLSSEPMDGPRRGPLTILPADKADVGWVPNACANENGGTRPCDSQRVGDVFTSSAGITTLNDNEAMGWGVDRARYTLPYRINTNYWKTSGGTDNPQNKTAQLVAATTAFTKLARKNEYVNSWACRGHYFAGAINQETTDRTKRYRPACNQ